MGKATLNEELLSVSCAVKSEDDVITKRDFCVYCKKLKGVITRHLFRVHINETDVKEAAVQTDKSHHVIAKIKEKITFFTTLEQNIIPEN